MEKRWLNPVEAASALSISRSKLYELMAAGRIGSVRIDSCRRVPVRALQDYVDRLAQENCEDLSAA
ncbi:MAG TPA: helix-turn-helix domain-containing protein [Thermoanaerobaculia bacterium]|nr:helix-turn-helix domain-containing protein [Thermoanaerobaculia bacterium]